MPTILISFPQPSPAPRPSAPNTFSQRVLSSINMGKSTTTTTCLPPSKKAGLDSIEQPPRQCSLMNYVLFVLCTLSLGCTAYAAYRQCHVDDTRIRHIRRLDERITVLEEKLRLVAETTKKTEPLIATTEVQSPMRRISIANNNATTNPSLSSSSSSSSAEEDAFTYPAAEMLQALHKLSQHDTGIERLRRDISQLQSSRMVRQSSMIQSSADCGCPAGEYR